jgi:hypothetical protein
MSHVYKSGIFLFGLTTCLIAANRWRANEAAAASLVESAAANDARRASERISGGESDSDSDCNSDSSDDSLDGYFDDGLEYNVRDDFTMEDGDGRFKMVLLVNMKLRS